MSQTEKRTIWKKKRRFNKLLIPIYAVAAVLTFVNAFPTYWIFISSFKSLAELTQRFPTFFPVAPTTYSYNLLFTLSNPDFGHILFNSAAIAVATASVTIVSALLGAYSLARYKLRFGFGSKARGYFLFSQMIGGFFVLIPLYVVIKALGVYDTYIAVILPFLAFSLPFSIMLLNSYFSTLDVRMEEAAMIDGCSRLGALWRIALPLSLPGAFTAWLFVFLSVWTDFAIDLTFTQNAARTAVPSIWVLYTSPFGNIFAPALFALIVIVLIPPTIVFSIFQRRFIEGLTGGALKG